MTEETIKKQEQEKTMDEFNQRIEKIHFTIAELKEQYHQNLHGEKGQCFDPEQSFKDEELGLFNKGKILSMSIPFVKACGVYFLIFDNFIVYIGKSIDVHSRVSRHKSEEIKCFDRWTYFLVDNEDLDKFEQAYIRKFKPFYNLQCL